MRLPAVPAGYSLISYDQVTSTNDEAATLAEGGAADGTLVWARTQTQSRGRQGRPWQSLTGNLFCSWILRPDCKPDKAAQLGFVATLAVGEMLSKLTPPGSEIRYKWPNDVLVSGAKISGILLESRLSTQGVLAWLVLGVGVNVQSHPELSDYRATSLRVAGASADLSVERVLEVLSSELAAWRVLWQEQGFGPIRQAWLTRAAALGSEIELRLPQEVLRGTFRDLDQDGALLLDVPGQSLRRITAGDVHFPA